MTPDLSYDEEGARRKGDHGLHSALEITYLAIIIAIIIDLYHRLAVIVCI